MKIKDNIIISATKDELYDYYLKRDYDDVMSFTDFIKNMELSGVEVIK